MPPWMREKLEELRREAEPERPSLRIPAPDTRYDPRREQEEPESDPRGVCIIDLNFS